MATRRLLGLLRTLNRGDDVLIELRNYQTEAVDSIARAWRNGCNPLVDMATGTGKSLVIASLAQRLLAAMPSARIQMLVHVKELVSQNAQALLKAWPKAPLGIYCAGLNRRDTNSQIVFSSIDSVYRRADLFGRRDLIIIDECHRVPTSGNGKYLTFIEKARLFCEDLRVVGFTATPYRLDCGRLDEGADSLFTETVYSYDIAAGIADGYLSPLVSPFASRCAKHKIDTSNVGRLGGTGDFKVGELEAAANKDIIVDGACREIVSIGADRKSWLVFCVGVEHACNVLAHLRRLGVNAEMVIGTTPSGERDRIFKAYKAGKIRCLVGCQVFTTGFDAPSVDLIVLLRPTMSTSLYVQMLGRGTRKADNKENCLVLDFANNIMTHGPVDSVRVRTKKKGGEIDAEAPTKICPSCDYYMPAAIHQCTNCGHEWPIDEEPKHSGSADFEAPVLTSEIVKKWLPVKVRMHDRNTGKNGKPDSVCVEYMCGFASYREYICPEHTGFAAVKAGQWWRAMGGNAPAPKTVSDMLRRMDERELIDTEQIMVIPDGKYMRVSGYWLQDGTEIDHKLRAR